MDPEVIAEILSGLSFITGTLFCFLGGLGILRMPDPYMRAQAATKSGTLGLSLIFIGVALHFIDLASISKSVTIILFTFLSIPIGAHMITRAIHAAGIPPGPEGTTDELKEERD